MVLRVNGATPSSVFGVFGAKENTATFALGWCLEQSPALRDILVRLIAVVDIEASTLSIDLQRHSEDGGYTDIELLIPNRLHVIIEAKKGWVLPHQDQLMRYASRFQDRDTRLSVLVSISSADRVYATARLPSDIDGVEVTHLAWSDVRTAVQQAFKLTQSGH